MYALGYPNGGGNANFSMFIDATTAISTDADPYVYSASSLTSGATIPSLFPISSSAVSGVNSFGIVNISTATAQAGGYPQAYLKKGLGGEGYVPLSAMIYGYLNASGTLLWVAPGNLGSDPNDDKDDLFPVMWARGNNSVGSGQLQTSPTGYKGLSSVFQFNSVVRSNQAVVVQSGVRYMIINNCIAVPWIAGVTNPVL
jgi:hypothetical protein